MRGLRVHLRHRRETREAPESPRRRPQMQRVRLYGFLARAVAGPRGLALPRRSPLVPGIGQMHLRRRNRTQLEGSHQSRSREKRDESIQVFEMRLRRSDEFRDTKTRAGTQKGRNNGLVHEGEGWGSGR